MISNDSNSAEDLKTFSKNGIFFKYPGHWNVATTEIEDTIASVADPNTIDSFTGLAQTSVVVQKQNLTMPIERFFNDTYSKLSSDSSFNLISEGNLTIGEYNANEFVYTIDQLDTRKKVKAVWIQNDQEVYVVLFTASESEFDKQIKYFDFILSTFRINS